MTAKQFLERYDNGENFKEGELQDIFYLDFEGDDNDVLRVIEEKYGEPRRWNRRCTRWVEINGRFFELDADEALTELQDTEYYIQPKEVTYKQVTRTIIVTENEYSYIKRGQ